jgi:zinc-ribbon domain
MFCRHCGAKLKLDAKFCETCGNPRDVKSDHQKEESNSSHTESEIVTGHKQYSGSIESNNDKARGKVFHGESNGKKSQGQFLRVLIIVVVCIFFIYFIFKNSAATPPSQTNTTNNTNNAVSAVSATTSSVSTDSPVIVPQENSQPVSHSLQNASADTNGDITTSFISQVEPAIVLVACFPPDYSTSDDFDYGSGVSVNYEGTIYIETNYHVYNEVNTGGGSPTCFAYYPGPAPDFSITANSASYQLNFYSDNYDPDTSEDVADFTLGSTSSSIPLAAIPVINDTSLTGIGSGCSTVNNGDSVTIFGYPASGNYLNVSETVTQGTISGQTPGPVYKFEGAIDHGNSGGLAILDKSSCDLGIPTLGVSGLTAGTGYIQSVSLSRQHVTLTNDQICQDDYGGNSDYTGNNSQGGIICGCESGYTWNAGDTACVALPAETGYQVCSAYPNETWDGTYNSSGQYNCVCDSGYSVYNNECVSGYTYCTDTEGYGTNYDPDTNSCTCDAGYMYSNGQCEEGNLYCSDRYGVGAEYDYSTDGCECEYGYESDGNECVYVGYNY